METNQFTQSSIEQKKDGELIAILYLLQSKLEKLKDDVDSSYALVKIGEETPLSKEIKETIEDPIGSLFKMTSSIDLQVKNMIERFVRAFFITQSEIIESVYNTKVYSDDLHYSIVLKNDSIENRQTIFKFFDVFDLIEGSNRYHIIFQFVPIELIGKINTIEKIDLQTK